MANAHDFIMKLPDVCHIPEWLMPMTLLWNNLMYVTFQNG